MMILASSQPLTTGGITGPTVIGLIVGCGVMILGAAFGIGWIGSKAVESIARQPEAGQRIFSAMIIAAALIEGVTFFALLIGFLTLYWGR